MHNLGVSEKKFSVYRFSGDSLKKEGEFLGYGRGPYEMMIARVAFDPDTRSLTMLADYNRENRFCRVSLDPPENLYDVSTWEYRQLSFIGDCSLGEPCLIDRSSYLTMGHHTGLAQYVLALDIDGGGSSRSIFPIRPCPSGYPRWCRRSSGQDASANIRAKTASFTMRRISSTFLFSNWRRATISGSSAICMTNCRRCMLPANKDTLMPSMMLARTDATA